MKNSVKHLLNALLYMGLFVVSFFVLFEIFKRYAVANLGMTVEETGQYAFLVFVVAMALTSVICFFIYKATKRNLIKECSFSKFDLKSLGLLLVGSYALVIFIEALIYMPGFGERFPTIFGYVNSIGSMGVSYVTFAVMFSTVFFEEIIFRGAMYGEVRKAFPKAIAIIIGAAFYGVANVIVGMGIPMGIGAFISAIFYIMAYDAKGSLWAPIFVQVVCMSGMIFTTKIGLANTFASSGQGVLIAIAVVGILVSIGSYYMVYRISQPKTKTNMSVVAG